MFHACVALCTCTGQPHLLLVLQSGKPSLNAMDPQLKIVRQFSIGPGTSLPILTATHQNGGYIIAAAAGNIVHVFNHKSLLVCLIIEVAHCFFPHRTCTFVGSVYPGCKSVVSLL